MSALEGGLALWNALGANGARYRFCANAGDNVCNWMLPDTEPSTFCESCRHNSIVPDLSIAANVERWGKIELAKRYVIRALMRWRLPRPDRKQDPERGLAFDLIADETRPDGRVRRVLTGHDNGLITINIAEADDAEREARRKAMREPYRTLVGHIRHEVGHYYWDRLVNDEGRIDAFREAFGDETQDYGAALERHYRDGAQPDWIDRFVSAYASSHPWEDFAETWAHYLHIVDALETARSYGIDARASFTAGDPRGRLNFEPYASELRDPAGRRLGPAHGGAERRQPQHGSARPLSFRPVQGGGRQARVHPHAHPRAAALARSGRRSNGHRGTGANRRLKPRNWPPKRFRLPARRRDRVRVRPPPQRPRRTRRPTGAWRVFAGLHGLCGESRLAFGWPAWPPYNLIALGFAPDSSACSLPVSSLISAC